MSETILTKGWKGPKGKCDFCKTKKATHWFGDSSVALCDDEPCVRENRVRWDKMVEEIDNQDSEW